MRVVTARVHDPVILGAVGNFVLFLDRQSVHVGAQCDRAAATGGELADAARDADRGAHLVAQGSEPLRDEVGRARLSE